MAARQTSYRQPAVDAYNELERQEQNVIQGYIDFICESPELDPPLKIAFLYPPKVLTLFYEEDYWLLYDLPDDETVEFWMIGGPSDDPPVSQGQGATGWQA